MYAYGWKLTAPNSPTRKQYTMVAMGNRVIINYGAGNAAGRTQVDRTEDLAGANGEDKFSSMLNAMASHVASAFTERNQRRGDYSQVDIAPVTVRIAGNDDTDEVEVVRNFVQKAEGLASKPAVSESVQQMYRYVNETKKNYLGGNAPANATSRPRKAQNATPPPPKLVVKEKFVRPNGEEYYPRTVNGHQDVALLRKMREAGIFVRLYGPPGGGKNALAEAAFPDIVTVTGHGDMTVAHFAGSLLPTPSGGWEWADGPLTRAMKAGVPFMMDEITRVPTEVLAVLYSVMDGRGELRLDDRPDVEPVKAAPGFYVIAGYNPDTLGARALDEALISRFRVALEITTDFDTAKSLGVPADAVRLASNLNTRSNEDKDAGGPGVWVPQMRELLTFRDIIAAGLDVEFATATLLGACPREEDQETVMEVAKDVFGMDITPLSLGRRF